LAFKMRKNILPSFNFSHLSLFQATHKMCGTKSRSQINLMMMTMIMMLYKRLSQ